MRFAGSTLWWAPVGGVVVAGGLFAMRFGLPHSLIAGLAVAIAILALPQMFAGERLELPAVPFDSRDGARREVSSLTWSLLARTGVSTQARLQLQRLAGATLADAGVDPSTPDGARQARQILGASADDFRRNPHDAPLDARGAGAILTTLEKLESTR